MMRFSLVLTALLLSSCNVLPERDPVTLYQLPPPAQESAGTDPVIAALRIDRPLTSEALAGSRLLIMTADNQFQAFAGMRLEAPVPLLWRDWMLDAFWRDGRVSGLSAASQGLQSPLELTGVLREFHVDNTGDRPAAVILFDATLISTIDRTIIASRRFATRHPMAALDAATAVQSLSEAASELVAELIDWSITEGLVRSQGNAVTDTVSPMQLIASGRIRKLFPLPDRSFERYGRQVIRAAADRAPPGYPHSEKCPEKRSFFAVQRWSLIASARITCRPHLALRRSREIG